MKGKKLKIILAGICILLGIIACIRIFFWQKLYDNFLEQTPPNIEVVGEIPQGIGINPVSIKLHLSDAGAGLYEIKVNIHQKGLKKELLRQKFAGEKEEYVTINIAGLESGLKQGDAELSIKVFDSSFWFSKQELQRNLIVDFKTPVITPISAQHNAVQGGSQLIFYEAKDLNLILSGVKIGNHFFQGYKASELDPSFASMPDLYACIYGVDLADDPKSLQPRLYAEDIVGNSASKGFYNKIAPVRYATLRTSISNAFMSDTIKPLIEHEKDRFANSPDNSTSDIDNFKLVNETLRRLDRDKIAVALLKNNLSNKLWSNAFIKPAGAARTEYGHILNFIYDGQSIDSLRQLGFYFLSDGPAGEVRAINSGKVIFTDNIGTYGKVVGIAHGLGLVSLYANLSEITVNAGDEVEARSTIGKIGSSGFALTNGVQIEIWLSGVPINPREWWDVSWYQAHIIDKIESVKSSLGISSVHQF